MIARFVTLGAAFLLASCGSPADEGAGSAGAEAEAPTDAVVPGGPAIDILAFGDSLFAGYRLDSAQS